MLSWVVQMPAPVSRHHRRHPTKGAKQIVELYKGEVATNCDGTDMEYVIQQFKADGIIMEQVTADALTEVGVLETLLETLSGHFQYLITSAQAYTQWAKGSQNLVDELDSLVNGSNDDKDRQRQFIRAACRTTQGALQQAFVDFKAVGDRLTTGAGHRKTSATMTIPKSPPEPHSGNSIRPTRKYGYLMSVWNTTLFDLAFSDDGGAVGETSFLTAAIDRAEDFHDEVCRIHSSPFDPHRWLVRKTISGDPWNGWDGRLSVSLTLSDVIRGGEEASGLNSRAFETEIQSKTQRGEVYTQTFPLMGPVLLNVGYSACLGPADDPCCGDCPRMQIGTADGHPINPHIVQLGALVPTLHDCNDNDRTTTDFPTHDGLGVATCLNPVNVAPNEVEMEYISFNAGGIVDSDALEHLCSGATTSLQLQQLRGRPAIGMYELTIDGPTAFYVIHETRNGVPPANPPDPSALYASVTGLELFFFVGAEPVGVNDEGVYETEPFL